MKRNLAAVLLSLLLAGCSAGAQNDGPRDLKQMARESLARISGETEVQGLKQPVEVIRDQWGIPHIYAGNTDDLFFAQGYVAAQDRLWQLEIWRRMKEGRMAEILGPAAADRDRLARLTMYRGSFDDGEWTSYHPEGKRIVSAFVNGINAFINENRNNLAVEFKLTGIQPGLWKPETPLLRETGFGGAGAELRLARDVASLDVKEANTRSKPDPWDDLKVPDGLDVSIIGEEVQRSISTQGGPLPKPPILERFRSLTSQAMAEPGPPDWTGIPGSNNWVISGSRTSTGRPIVANDPHRAVTLPSLRYIVHLNAPGWNVIGSGEPAIPGVAIGHNERIAWGLTIVGTDQHDVFVEEVNPANPNEVRWNGKWEPLRIVREEIAVKGENPRVVELKFSRHGPIFHEDRKNNRAYALASALFEPGTAPYLGALRLNQTSDCRKFLDEVMYWKAPSENMICGDVEGNISWQAAALTPDRRGWHGRLPVPGTGQYEWDGFRKDLPREYNPASGFIATANHNIHPPGYWPPVMFKSSDPARRIMRLIEVLTPAREFSIEEARKLQLDGYSSQAKEEQIHFTGWTSSNPEIERARASVAAWNFVLDRESRPAVLYMAWRETVDRRIFNSSTPAAERRTLSEAGLVEAVENLKKEQGTEESQWRWGRMNTQAFPHPVLREFDLPTVEKGGGGGTVAAMGATYREIFDVGNWDAAIGTNVPGQSGQPESPFYGNLLQLWANNQYIPLVYSRKAVDERAAHRLTLKPR